MRRGVHTVAALGLGSALVLGSACGDDSDPSMDTAAVDSGAASSGGSDPTTGGASGNALPTVRVAVDASMACGADGSLHLRATQVGCVKLPPAPCTLPMPPRVVESAPIACPSTESEAELLAEIEFAGRYSAELVVTAADGTESVTCFSDTAESEIVVDDDAFVDNPTIEANAEVGC